MLLLCSKTHLCEWNEGLLNVAQFSLVHVAAEHWWFGLVWRQGQVLVLTDTWIDGMTLTKHRATRWSRG